MLNCIQVHLWFMYNRVGTHPGKLEKSLNFILNFKGLKKTMNFKMF